MWFGVTGVRSQEAKTAVVVIQESVGSTRVGSTGGVERDLACGTQYGEQVYESRVAYCGVETRRCNKSNMVCEGASPLSTPDMT